MERHGKKKVKRFKMIGDVAVDATPVAIDTMANTDAVESEEWKDIRRICRPKYIKADSDTSEETEPEEISTRPYVGLTQRRLL